MKHLRSLCVLHDNDCDVLSFIKPDWRNGPWIAGGAALAWYKGEEVGNGDIDVYFKSKEDFDKVADMVLPKKTKSTGLGNLFSIVDSGEDSGHKDVKIAYQSDNAITVVYKEKWKIQFIRHTFYDTPEDIINNFDISVCQLATDGTNLINGEHTLADIKNNILRVINYRPAGIARYLKYKTYGYKPLPGTLTNFLSLPDVDNAFANIEDDYEY